MSNLPKYYCGQIESALFENEVIKDGESIKVTNCWMKLGEGTDFKNADKYVNVNFWNKEKDDLKLANGDAIIFIGGEIKNVEYENQNNENKEIAKLSCYKITSFLDKDKYLTLTTENNITGIIATEPKIESIETAKGTKSNLVKFAVSVLDKETKESKLVFVSLWRNWVQFTKGDQVKFYGAYYAPANEDGSERVNKSFNAKDYKMLQTREQMHERKPQKDRTQTAKVKNNDLEM